eukprot:CAMPEP_0205819692 /NCGR_PEP_ID=MMETSP0206-20130828/2157_1 /ASSEMBLY_ACC=CAM_ASM_000279 /TAXON_ID=36767 /ORGANISM="Euplotes focardii, Strain TN1" /LENGTH=93 /DNA_ID=CAMNT_0053113575 /DNA_START=49 /DNA_END=327 /DNA_ORIENTATION=-
MPFRSVFGSKKHAGKVNVSGWKLVSSVSSTRRVYGCRVGIVPVPVTLSLMSGSLFCRQKAVVVELAVYNSDNPGSEPCDGQQRRGSRARARCP